MDFNDTPEEAAFRARHARSWRPMRNARAGRGRCCDWAISAATRCSAARIGRRRRRMQALPPSPGRSGFGGREASPILPVIYQQEEENYAVPRGLFEIGLGMCIPTMMAYAKPEQLDRYVRPALRGEEVWCQLFSEPAGGSDLAALRTRAERDGDDWIINGQKIWTSGAHLSDFGIIVVRTDPNVPKHEGLTFFFLDMQSPGIEIRPIHQMSGASHFNEVFFTDVRVPDRAAARRGGARVEGLAHHADERAPRGGRGASAGCRGPAGAGPFADAGRQPRSPGACASASPSGTRARRG